MSDSLVRVSRRVGPLRRRHDPGEATPGGIGLLVNPRPGARWATAASGDGGVPADGAQTDRAHPGGARPPRRRQSGSLASNDFTYYFTFFPKFFSSFPHGTCSLSVSRKYLALDGHYHPISAAVPSNTTHGTDPFLGKIRKARECYPLRFAISTTNYSRLPRIDPVQGYNATARGGSFTY